MKFLPSRGADKAATAAAGTSATTGTAEQLVKKYMLASLPLGLVPIPLIDVAALTVVQLGLLSKLASLYKVDFSEQLATSLIGSLVGSGGSMLASRMSRRVLLRLIPGPGWIAGFASTSVFAGAATFAVGKVFIQHFESGGTFLTFDPDKVRDYYASQFTQGTAAVVETFAGVRP
jgi:uncharacterized protein (DUF697 family)